MPAHDSQFTGTVTGKSRVDGEGIVEVAFKRDQRQGRSPVGHRRARPPPGGGRPREPVAPQPRRHRRHRPDGVLQGVGPQRAAARLRGDEGRARRCRALPARGRRPDHLHDGLERGGRGRAQPRHPERCRCSRAFPTAAAAACAVVMQAAMAVATGVADVVVCYRAFNERSGMRFGGPGMAGRDAAAVARLGTARTACSRRRAGSRCTRGATCTSTASPTRTSAASRWSTASTPRPTPTRGSTSGRSRSRITRARAGSSSRCCGCSTVARRATAASRWSSPRPSAPATCASRRRSIAAAAQGAAGDGELMTSYYRAGDHRPSRDGRGGQEAVGRFGPHARRHPDRVPLRSLHAVRACAARGARLLRARRGQGLRHHREPVDSAGACPSTPAAVCSARPTSTA